MTHPGGKIPESVLVVIYTPQREVLLLERADCPGFWQSVTGSRETTTEAFADTALREVSEETGIRGDFGRLVDWNISNVYEIYPAWRARYAPGVTHNTEHVFGLCVARDIKISLNPSEHTCFDWLPWREAADRCFSPSNAEAVLMLPRFMR